MKSQEQIRYEANHPEMFVPDAGIDRHECKRTVPMEVLSLGMSRTGTASIKAALQILGYNDCYHWFNIYTNIADADMWVEAFNAKYRNLDGQLKFGREQWDQLLGHCMAVTDAPANCFAPELIEAYPDARVVLVERDIDAWYRSFDTIIKAPYRPDFWIASILDPTWMKRVYKLTILWIETFFKAKDQQEFEMTAKKMYVEHYAEVRRITPKDRLLEYKLGTGWEPLCTFLGKEVPDVEFPWINEAAALEEKMDVLGKKSMGRALRNLGSGVGLLAVAGASVWWATGGF